MFRRSNTDVRFILSCRRGIRGAHLACRSPADAWNDSDGDSIPDKAELRSFDDRQNFRAWFAAIAEMQFYRISESGIESSATAPVWSVSPGARPCVITTAHGFKEWAASLNRSLPTSEPTVSRRGPSGEKLFVRTSVNFRLAI